ncbi:MAG: DUF6600 domain-containing protein [Chthoniobacterales bacterium]
MKRFLFALAIFALLLPGSRKAEARTDVSIDFFYDNLGSDGNWIEAGDYGYCWQPSVAVSNRDWRPYADGYWAYTDVGWTWVSYEDFGWATYHYGRWARLRGRGWVWVPGYEWGPAWVSWRTGGNYVGWAPLPPRYARGGGEPIYEGRAINGRVDVEFNIGPSYYNFVDIRYIGEPVLRDRLYAPSQNITYVNQTVNVTNITYNNSTVYNYGPDYNRLSAYSTRPIQRLNLQRQTDVDYGAAGRTGGFTKVQGNQLLVAAPNVMQRPEHRIAPPVVKEKIASPDFETGWSGVTDPQARAKLEQKMKTEDGKIVPPPQMTPAHPAALSAASPAAASPLAQPATAAEEKGAAADDANAAQAGHTGGRGNGKRDRNPAAQTLAPVDPGAAAANDANAPSATPETIDDRGHGRGMNQRGAANLRGKPADVTPATAPTVSPQSDMAPVVAPKPADRGKGNQRRAQPPLVSPGSPDGPPIRVESSAAATGETREDSSKNKRRAGNRQEIPQPSAEAAPQPAAPPAQEYGGPGRGRGKQKADRIQAPAVEPQAPPRLQPQIAPAERFERQARPERGAVPPPPPNAPAVAPAPAEPVQQGRPERGNKKKKGDDAPPEKGDQ